MRKSAASTLILIAASLLASLPASAINQTRTVFNVAQLKQAFVDADQNPSDLYFVYLAGGTYDVSTVGTLRLTRGAVVVVGNPSMFSTNWQYTISGGDQTIVFDLQAAPGSWPYLSLNKVAVMNGLATGSFGGGIRVQGGFVDIEDSYIGSNRADWQGSGMYLGANSSAYIYNSEFDHNINTNSVSENCGGGMVASGGGLALFGDSTSTVEIVNSTFKRNKACRGGAISAQGGANDGPQVYLYNTSILQNEGLYEGGGLFAYGNGRFDVYFTTIARNSAATVSNISSLTEERGGGGVSFSAFRGNLYMGASILGLNTVVSPSRIRYSGVAYNNSDCQITSSGGTSTRFNFVAVLGNIVGKRDRCDFLGSTSWFGIGTDSRPFDLQLQPTTNLDFFDMSYARPVHSTAASWLNFRPASSPGSGGLTLDCRASDQLGQTSSNPCSHGAIEN